MCSTWWKSMVGERSSQGNCPRCPRWLSPWVTCKNFYASTFTKNIKQNLDPFLLQLKQRSQKQHGKKHGMMVSYERNQVLCTGRGMSFPAARANSESPLLTVQSDYKEEVVAARKNATDDGHEIENIAFLDEFAAADDVTEEYREILENLRGLRKSRCGRGGGGGGGGRV